MFKFMFICVVLIVLSCPFAFSSTDTSANSSKNLAEKIILLRDEVSQLSDDFKTDKELLKSKIQTLALEKMDLDSKIRRQNIQLKSVTDKITKAKSLKQIKHPEFDRLIDQFISYENTRLTQTLPFKKAERVQYLNQIKKDFLENKNSADKTLQLLWSHIEDEIQLAKDISLDKDILNIEGKPTLVEIAKVGMLMMFYKTSDGVYGFMEYSPSGWTPKPFESTERRTLAESFFESLKKQIRTGFFEFPQIPFKPNMNPIKQNAKAGDKNDQA